MRLVDALEICRQYRHGDRAALIARFEESAQLCDAVIERVQVYATVDEDEPLGRALGGNLLDDAWIAVPQSWADEMIDVVKSARARGELLRLVERF